VSLKIFDVLGKQVATLVDENKIAGYYDVEFKGANFCQWNVFLQN